MGLGLTGALFLTGGVVVAFRPSADSATAVPDAQTAAPSRVGEGTGSDTDDDTAAANLAAVDEWVNGLGIPADATDDERLQIKLSYDLVTVPRAQKDTLLSLPGVRVVAPIETNGAVTASVLRSQSDLVRASIPDADIQANKVARVAGDQTPVPSWGLDAVDNPTATQDNHYRYDSAGAGTTIFVIDSGVQSNHPDFGGRVAAGKDFIGDGRGTEDCLGHGTHVAGIAAGTTYGVAKQATIIPVRVFACSQTGTSSDVWYALNWITDNYRWPSQMVINMSLTVSKDFSINNMVSFANSRGFIVVAAAGNEGQDACNSSPASSPSAITVGYYTKQASLSVYSNRGSCVKVLAPGGEITSDYLNSGTLTASGTSMAAPHVAGLAARLLEAHPSWVKNDVMTYFQSQNATGHIANVPSGTVNLVASIPVAAAVPKVTSLTTGAASGGISLAWTTNGVGTFTAFSITVTDTTTGRTYPVTVAGSRSSTVFTNVVAGHTYTVSMTGTATMPSGASLTTDPVSASGP